MDPLAIGCVWIVAAAITAIVPMKHQMIPGIALLIAAPILLIWIGMTHGWAWLAFGLFAFVSMFRRPLIYFARCAFGLPNDRPNSPE
jgi:hypothetical protein